jgi:hypothetical protein
MHPAIVGKDRSLGVLCHPGLPQDDFQRLELEYLQHEQELYQDLEEQSGRSVCYQNV